MSRVLELSWREATEVAELIETVPGGLDKYQPRLRYLLLDEGALDESEQLAVRNLAAALFRLEKSRVPEDMRDMVGALVEWLKAPKQTGLRRAFTVWIRRVLLPGRLPGAEIPEVSDLQEVNAMLAERVIKWTEEWEQQGLRKGLQQGLQQGVQQGEALVLKRMLVRRFGPLPRWADARLAQASPAQLEALADRVLDVESLEELFR